MNIMGWAPKIVRMWFTHKKTIADMRLRYIDHKLEKIKGVKERRKVYVRSSWIVLSVNEANYQAP